MEWDRDYSEDVKSPIVLRIVPNPKLNPIYIFAYLPILEKYVRINLSGAHVTF